MSFILHNLVSNFRESSLLASLFPSRIPLLGVDIGVRSSVQWIQPR